MNEKLKNGLALFFILLLAFVFRFNNINWDSGFHLNPDERFLTMVSGAMEWPKSPQQYFDPATSKLNPGNIDFNFFVYGIFPVLLNKGVATISGMDNYNDFTFLGRGLSAFFDILLIIFIYKAVFLFEKKYKISPKAKFLAAFFYAVTVFPIQQSHFFTVDTFLNFFMFASFYFSLKYFFEKKEGIKNIILSSIFFGIAMACKVTAVFILPLIIFFLVFKSFSLNKDVLLEKIFKISLFSLLSYVSLRIFDPYYFQNGNFFDPRINLSFLESLRELKSFEGANIWYPPAVQWISKMPIIFSLSNLIFFGVGIFYFLFLVAGVLYLMKKPNKAFTFILIWIAAFFLYQSTQFVKSIRYFIFIYPFLAIVAGLGFCFVMDKRNKIFIYLGLLTVLLWPLMFSSIYMKENTRVTASKWIYKNIPVDSTILSEYWDDPLPLDVSYTKKYSDEQLHIFDQDSSEKWQKINKLLEKSDYYILSSNRGWGSITTVPNKYPKMSKFYKDLLANKLDYKKVIEFDSYPSLSYLGIPLEFPDYWAEETFTVYDHPQVMIFKNEKTSQSQ